MNISRGFISIGFILIVGIGLVLGGFGLYKAFPSLTSANTATQSDQEETYTDATYGFTLSYPLSIGIGVTDANAPTQAGQATVTRMKFTSSRNSENPVFITIEPFASGGPVLENRQATTTPGGITWTYGTFVTTQIGPNNTRINNSNVGAMANIGTRYALELSRKIGAEGESADIALLQHMLASFSFNEANVEASQQYTQNQQAAHERALDAAQKTEAASPYK